MSIIYVNILTFTYDHEVFMAKLQENTGDTVLTSLGKFKLDELAGVIPAFCQNNDIHYVRLIGNNEYSQKIKENILAENKYNYNNNNIEVEIV